MNKKYRRLKDKKLFLFDIDGVIKLNNTLIEGALDLFNYIESINGKSIFITNNSTMSNEDYVKYFNSKNFNVNQSNFLTALDMSVDYLLNNHLNDLIYVVGTESLIKELRKNNLNITNEYNKDVKVLLVGFDSELCYQKLVDACNILENNEVSYLATNIDLRCPVDFGFIPDCGAIVKMIECVCDKKANFLGKPSKEFVEMAIKRTGFSKEETLVIGDRLYTDIACGINAKVDTCLVYTGEAKIKDLKKSKYKPTYEFDNVKELLDYIRS